MYILFVNSACYIIYHAFMAPGHATDEKSRLSMSNDPTKAVTTHSFTLRTPLFSLGYTWRQEESDLGPDQISPQERTAKSTNGPADEKQYVAGDTGTEARRRQRIMRLLEAPPQACPSQHPPDRQKNGNPISARQACGYYQRIGMLGDVDDGDQLPRG